MAPPIWGLGDRWFPVHQRSRPLRRAPSWRLPASGKPANGAFDSALEEEAAHIPAFSAATSAARRGFEFADVPAALTVARDSSSRCPAGGVQANVMQWELVAGAQEARPRQPKQLRSNRSQRARSGSI
jgi:hypothetical protein